MKMTPMTRTKTTWLDVVGLLVMLYLTLCVYSALARAL